VRLAILVLTPVLSLGMAGTAACASGSPPAANTGQSQTQQATFQVMQRYSACAREHGATEMPDPVIAADGSVDWPNAPGLSHLPQPVRDACDAILNDLPASARIGQPSARPDVPLLRRFAQCMRTQPQMSDWPDPDANGTFHLPADLGGKNGPRQPAFLSARAACARFNPSGQLQLAGR
jgi:hypothetical protein